MILSSTLRNTVINLLNARNVTGKAAALRQHAAGPYQAPALIRSEDDY